MMINIKDSLYGEPLKAELMTFAELTDRRIREKVAVRYRGVYPGFTSCRAYAIFSSGLDFYAVDVTRVTGLVEL